MAESYIHTVEAASNLQPGIVNGEPDYWTLIEEEMAAAEVPSSMRSSALRLFTPFYERYPEWGREVALGLPIGMNVLALLVRDREEAGQDTADLPNPAKMLVADMLNDVGKLVVERQRPDVIESSRTGIGWDDEKYEAMKPHTIYGYIMAKQESLDEEIAVGIGTHHTFSSPSYGLLWPLCRRTEIMARVEASTDFALAAATRKNSRTPEGGEPAIRDFIVHGVAHRLAGIASDETTGRIAEATADRAIHAGKLLGSRCLVHV